MILINMCHSKGILLLKLFHCPWGRGTFWLYLKMDTVQRVVSASDKSKSKVSTISEKKKEKTP